MAEIFVLLMLLVAFWGVNQVKKINIVSIDEEDVEINKEVQEYAETGVMKGYRNIAILEDLLRIHPYIVPELYKGDVMLL